MNDQQLGQKVRQDVVKVREDISSLVGDSATRVRNRFDKFTGDAQKTVTGAANTVKEDVGQGLSRYNAGVQKVANKAPGGFGKKAAKYPWVTVTISLALGLLVGGLLIPGPGRQTAGVVTP